MKAIKNFNGFKKSLLSATNGNMVESFDSSIQFGGCEYQSYRVYVDDVRYYNMFVIYNFATNTYDVSLETSTCAVSTMSRVCKTQKALIDSVVRWCYYSYLNTKEISVDSEEYTDRCTETNKIKGHIYIDTDSLKVASLPESITDIIADDNSSYNIELLRAKQFLNTKYGNSFRKHLHAIINPEWHHVSMATLANIDNDKLDEKRQRYFKIYKELIKTVSDLHKCKTAATYQIRWRKFKQVIADDIYYRGTTLYMTRFLDAKISMCNVQCGLWPSVNEKATSFIKSRRYSSTTLK